MSDEKQIEVTENDEIVIPVEILEKVTPGVKESDRLFPAAINPLRARQAQPEPPRDTLQEARELYRKVSSQSPPEGIARSASAEVAAQKPAPATEI